MHLKPSPNRCDVRVTRTVLCAKLFGGQVPVIIRIAWRLLTIHERIECSFAFRRSLQKKLQMLKLHGIANCAAVILARRLRTHIASEPGHPRLINLLRDGCPPRRALLCPGDQRNGEC